jgi:hypothetical protein
MSQSVMSPSSAASDFSFLSVFARRPAALEKMDSQMDIVTEPSFNNRKRDRDEYEDSNPDTLNALFDNLSLNASPTDGVQKAEKQRKSVNDSLPDVLGLNPMFSKFKAVVEQKGWDYVAQEFSRYHEAMEARRRQFDAQVRSQSEVWSK